MCLVLAISGKGYAQHITDIIELSVLTVLDESEIQNQLGKRGWEYNGTGKVEEWNAVMTSWAYNRNVTSGTAKEWFYRGTNKDSVRFAIYKSGDKAFYKKTLETLAKYKSWVRKDSEFKSNTVSTTYENYGDKARFALILIENVADDKTVTQYEYWMMNTPVE